MGRKYPLVKEEKETEKKKRTKLCPSNISDASKPIFGTACRIGIRRSLSVSGRRYYSASNLQESDNLDELKAGEQAPTHSTILLSTPTNADLLKITATKDSLRGQRFPLS
ncbi:hypothetical protein FRB93_003952 [Tulasnella sp. JGI-2019a]|nr:hypothetical protein FRB93_003952 [Tulasnella sp. JGI-2019a]